MENLEQALDAADLVAREALAGGIPSVLIGDLGSSARVRTDAKAPESA